MEKILYQTEQLRKQAEISTAYSGVLRLGVSETIVNTWLPDFLAQLHHDMPKLNVELTVDITSVLAEGIKDRTIDLAIINGTDFRTQYCQPNTVYVRAVLGCQSKTQPS